MVTGRQIVDLLFFKSWWTYRSGEPDWFEIPYHLFNLFEGGVLPASKLYESKKRRLSAPRRNAV